MPVSIPSSTLEKFTTFGDLLRFLRRRLGITQMELAIEVGYSDTQISRLEQNLRLPDIPTIEARFVSALGLEDEPKAVARLLDLAANVRREDAPALGLCPYKGLNYFEEADADLFVGREALTAKLVERVLSLASKYQPSESRFLGIVGASGSGKSSLVRAGLVSALRWKKISTDWHIYILTPTAHPLESLARALTPESNSVTAIATLMDDLAQDPRSLQIFARRKWGSKNGLNLLLVDQFEELFSLCHSEAERASFIDNLLTASSEVEGTTTVVITLRADFYAHCAGYVQLREALARHQEYIGAMNDEELRRAIEEPAQRGRWEFETGLVDLLLHDVGHEPGALPLLSHALLETWQRRRGRMITLSGYASSGGVRGAIAETAETVFTDQFTHDQQAIARRIFVRLTELSDETSTADTRRRATFEELILRPEEEASTRAVLKALADARLITTSADSAEVAHEALIREWPTLRRWLEDNREGLRIQQQLTEAAQAWSMMNRESDMLYRGARLAQSREWAVSHADEMNPLEHEFLNASITHSEYEVAEREAQQQRELEAARSLAEMQRARADSENYRAEEQGRSANRLRLRNRVIFMVGTLALILAILAWAFSLRSNESAVRAEKNLSIAQANAATAEAERQRAEHEARFARAREWAVAALNNLDVDPERSILLALQAVKETYETDHVVLPEVESALHQAVMASHVRMTIPAHTQTVLGIAYSPDGKRLATASQDGTAKVWDVSSGEEKFTLDILRQSGVNAIVYSSDGQLLATSSDDGQANVWDANTGRELLSLRGHTNEVWAIVFSADGKRIATASIDGTAKIWNATTGELLRTFAGQGGCVGSVAFSPDGMRAVTASCDNSLAKVWDINSGQELLTVSTPEDEFTSAIFSPDGAQVAFGNYVWDGVTGKLLFHLSGHTNIVHNVVYSVDGKRLATTSRDRTVRVWDAATGEELLTLWGHKAPVYPVAFSSDGKHLATGDEAGVVRIWDIIPDQELLTLTNPTGTEVGRILFSPDGSHLFVAYEYTSSGGSFPGAPGFIKVLNATTGEGVFTLPRPTIIVGEMAVSPDGALLAASTRDPTPKVWDAATGREVLKLSGHTGNVFGIAFSPDGKRLATGSPEDNTAKVWDVATGEMLITLTGHEDGVFSVAFSPDGTRLATTSWDRTAKVWDLASGQVVSTLTGHTDDVNDVAFDPNGNFIATASRDGTARLWDPATGQELFTLSGHTSTVSALNISPDGTRLATAGTDGTVKVWETATGVEVVTLPGNPTVAFSPDGTRLATGSRRPKEKGLLRLYLMKIEDLMALARSRVTRSLTTEECQKYLHVEACPTEPDK